MRANAAAVSMLLTLLVLRGAAAPAPGAEPVGFVRNVQTYAELLRWMVVDEPPSPAPGKEAAK